jgi:hypothetical protein
MQANNIGPNDIIFRGCVVFAPREHQWPRMQSRISVLEGDSKGGG